MTFSEKVVFAERPGPERAPAGAQARACTSTSRESARNCPQRCHVPASARRCALAARSPATSRSSQPLICSSGSFTLSSPPVSRRRKRYERKSRSEEHTSELQSLAYLVCRLLLEKKKK